MGRMSKWGQFNLPRKLYNPAFAPLARLIQLEARQSCFFDIAECHVKQNFST